MSIKVSSWQDFPKKHSEFGYKYLIVGYKWWVSVSRIQFSGWWSLTPGRQEGAKLFSYRGTSSSLWTIRSSIRIQVIHFSTYSTYIRNFFHRTVSVTFKYFMWMCCSSDLFFPNTLQISFCWEGYYFSKRITPDYIYSYLYMKQSRKATNDYTKHVIYCFSSIRIFIWY